MKADLGDGAAFYVGGTELLLIMKLGLAEYSHLIDLKRVGGLNELAVSDDEIAIGAAVSHLTIETNPEVRRVFPSMSEMFAGIGNLRVRNSGTIGGNLAFADPHSDPATFFTAVGATADVVDPTGVTRRIQISKLTLAPYTTDLEENELITSLTVPVPGPDVTVAHRHLRFRERPAVTATVVVRKVAEEVAEARVAVGSVCPIPIRLPEVEVLVMERPAGVEAAIREAVAAAVETWEDLDGSPDYKRHLAGVIVARCVFSAISDPETERITRWN